MEGLSTKLNAYNEDETSPRPSLLSMVKTARPSERLPILNAMFERFGKEMVEADIHISGGSLGVDNPFRRGLCQASNLPRNKHREAFWFRFYPRSLAYLIGDTGVGKSTLLYYLGIYAALNRPLFGLPFAMGRPMNILHIDPENAGNWEEGDGGNCEEKFTRLGIPMSERPPNLVFHDGEGLDLSQDAQRAHFGEFLRNPGVALPGWNYGQMDLVIVDTLAACYAVKEENSNSEAAARVKALTTLARKTGACVLLVHHDSLKSNAKGETFYGRGATATLAGVDTAFHIQARETQGDIDDDYQGGHGTPRSGMIRWRNTKNRFDGRGSIFLEMAGYDIFLRKTFDDWKAAEKADGDHGIPRAEKAKDEICLHLTDGRWYTQEQITGHLSHEGYPIALSKAALRVLWKDGKLARRGTGQNAEYALREIQEAQEEMRGENTRSVHAQNTAGNYTQKRYNIRKDDKADTRQIYDPFA